MVRRVEAKHRAATARKLPKRRSEDVAVAAVMQGLVWRVEFDVACDALAAARQVNSLVITSSAFENLLRLLRSSLTMLAMAA